MMKLNIGDRVRLLADPWRDAHTSWVAEIVGATGLVISEDEFYRLNPNYPQRGYEIMEGRRPFLYFMKFDQGTIEVPLGGGKSRIFYGVALSENSAIEISPLYTCHDCNAPIGYEFNHYLCPECRLKQ